MSHWFNSEFLRAKHFEVFCCRYRCDGARSLPNQFLMWTETICPRRHTGKKQCISLEQHCIFICQSNYCSVINKKCTSYINKQQSSTVQSSTKKSKIRRTISIEKNIRDSKLKRTILCEPYKSKLSVSLLRCTEGTTHMFAVLHPLVYQIDQICPFQDSRVNCYCP